VSSEQMQEIEAKFYVMDLKKIESRLQDLEARLIQPRIFETNIRFDLPGGGLRSKGQVLRLRQDTQARLTYKDGGINSNGIVSRTEIEFTVENFDKAKLLLEALGYLKLLEYDKYRTTYDLNGCHIMLDELPYGNFVEIEAEDFESILAIAEKLSFSMGTAISASYSALFERVKQSLGLTFPDLTFANFKDINITYKDLQVQPADTQKEDL
jgi:adenylate cyclase class 2